jgi:hypothetical protein
MVGTTQLLSILKLTVAVGNAAGVVLKDGKIGLSDFGILIGLTGVVEHFALIDFQAVLPEIKDLKPEEYSDLVDFVQAEFDIPQESVELTIENLLEKSKVLVKAIGSVVSALASLKAK